jgi:hypothetical protein
MKVRDLVVVDRHGLFSPCWASPVRRSSGFCWSSMGKHDFVVGPG